MVKSNLHLIDVTFVLLLDSEGLLLCSGLSLKRSLHGVQGALVVLPGVLKLLLLLLDPPVNLLAHLGHLQLSSQHLVLLLLQSGLNLLQSLLELLLLDLQLPPGLVQLMHGAAALAQLVQQVLDLLGQVLVLPPDGVQVLQHLLVGGLDAEVLGAVVAALGLAAGDLILQILSLQSPLVDNLVKVAAPLLNDGGVGHVTLTLSGQVIKLGLGPGLGLLQVGNLLSKGCDGVLGLSKSASDLGLVSLNLLRPGHTLRLVPCLPQLDVSKSLGQLTLHLHLGFILLN